MISPFKEPILITRPLLPEINKVNNKMQEIWDSKWLTNNGFQHNKLEKRLKDYLKIDNLVLYNNGTLALLLGIKALEITGEVITTPYTFPATTQCLDWNGLTPVFCDIDKDTLNIDVDKIEALITDKTSAILAVHVFGNPCNVYRIQEIADKYNLKVIYDGAHVFGSYVDGQPISSFGDITMFSFHATKLFNTVEGGAIAFNNSDLELRLNLLKNFGLIRPEEVVLSGLNAKMNEIQAGIGLEVLDIVEDERNRRKEIKATYEKGLANIEGIRILTKLDNENSSYQYFVIEVNESIYGKSRNWLYDELKKHNVFARRYFYPLCSTFEWYKDLESAKPENLPNAHMAVNETLAMPFYGELDLSSVEKICNIIRELKNR